MTHRSCLKPFCTTQLNEPKGKFNRQGESHFSHCYNQLATLDLDLTRSICSGSVDDQIYRETKFICPVDNKIILYHNLHNKQGKRKL